MPKRAYASQSEYKKLQDFLFRYIAAECGRLRMASISTPRPVPAGISTLVALIRCYSKSVLNDPTLRRTTFVMLHGGWPFYA